jgi:recombinational DNA repair protein (RecF pathway)
MILRMKLPREAPVDRHLSDAIERVGFRRWYERELLSSHAHLVLALLSAVAMLASLEAFSGASPAEKLMDIAFMIVSGAVTLWALRRYLYLMMRAEGVATQASCGDCGTYGRFKVVGQDRNPGEAQVCCSKCAHQWTLCP